MANLIFGDYASTQLAGNVAASAGQTTIVVVSSASFPSPVNPQYFYATLADASTNGQNRREVVKVTAIVGTSWTVVRGQGGTNPTQFSPGDVCELRFSKAYGDDIVAIVSGGAPTTSTYILQSADASLPNRRILTGSGRVSVTDGGATNPITLDAVVNGMDNTRLAQMPTNTLKGNNTGGLANAADLTVAQTIAMLSALVTTGGVVSISAGTAATRPAAGTAGRVYLATDTGEISRDTGAVWFLLEPALTGDVTTAAGAVASTISVNVVTNAKLAQMAGATFKANPIGSTQNAQDITASAAVALLPAFVASGGSAAKGVVPAPSGTAGSTAFLREDGTWSIPPDGYIFNVKTYGAVGNGATDDTSAINAAYAAVGAGGGALYFPAGTYKVTAALTAWSKTMTVYGDGWNASTISTNSSTLDVATISGTVRVTNLRFLPSVARTAGREINVASGGNQSVIDNCFFNGYFNAINVVNGPVALTIAHCQFANGTAATGVGISFAGGTDMLVTNIEIDANPAFPPAAGIVVNNIGDLTLTGCGISHQVTSLSIAPATGQLVGQVYAQGCFFDNGTNALLVQPTGTGAVVRGSFVNCWFSSCTAQGVRIIGGGTTTCDGFDFVNSNVILNGNNGFQVDAGALNVRVIGGEFGQNTGAGLLFNSTDFAVIGVRSGTPGALTGNTTYGININQATCNHFVVLGNDLRGNVVGPLNNTSTLTDQIVNNNLGEITEFFSGNGVLSGDWSSSGRLMVQTSTVNGQTVFSVRPNGAGAVGYVQAWNNSNIAAALQFADMRCGAAAAQFGSFTLNGGSQLPLRLTISGTTAVEVDTNLNLKYLKAIADQGYSLQVPLTGFTITVPDNCSALMLNPAGVLATGTITMPANPVDGQLVRLMTTQTVTALTLNANAGQTISGNVSTLTAAIPASYMYNLSGTKWYHCG